MEHVRIGEHDVRMIGSNFGSLIRNGIPVIDCGVEKRLALPGVKRLEKSLEGFQLIAAQGLDREEIQGPLLGVFEERFRDRQVINERFPACGR